MQKTVVKIKKMWIRHGYKSSKSSVLQFQVTSDAQTELFKQFNSLDRKFILHVLL